MSTTYVDIDGHDCKLGSMTKYCKSREVNVWYSPLSTAINMATTGAISSSTTVAYHNTLTDVIPPKGTLTYNSEIYDLKWRKQGKAIGNYFTYKDNGYCGISILGTIYGKDGTCVFTRYLHYRYPNCASSGSTTWYK